MEEIRKKTQALLRAVLISAPRGVPLRHLDKEYRQVTFSSIPVREMGYNSVEQYIRSIPDVASLVRDVDGEFVVKGVASESDKHVAKLIAKQRKPKKKAKAALRRPVFTRRPSFSSRPAFASRPVVNRTVVVGRPVVASRPVAMIHSRAPPVVRPTPVAPRSTSGTGIRFIPPRMMRQAAAQASAQSIERNLVQRGVARQVQQQAQNFATASMNSSRRVEVVSQPATSRTSAPQPAATTRTVTVVPRQDAPAPKKKTNKPKSPRQGSGPNWQEMEVTLICDYDNEDSDERVVYLSNPAVAKDQNTPKSSPLSDEDQKIYSRIKKLLVEKPKGLWLKRIGAEYKKIYGDELSSDQLERLKHLPDIARCEEFGGGNTIVYPPKVVEEKPPDKQSHLANGVSPRPIEFYTLRPQDLPVRGSATEVSVSHVDSPAHFFIHYKHNWDAIDVLSTKLNEFYQNPSKKTDLLPTIKPRLFCCAQFTQDDSWYRARITDSHTTDSSQAEVIYVDFGNYEQLPISRLRMLTKEHAEAPMMSVLCGLEGVVPDERDKWSTASTERFKELCAASEVLQMTLIRAEGHYLFVELKDTGGNDIKTALLKEGYIGMTKPADSSSSTTSSSNSASSSLTSSSSTDSFVSVTTTSSSSSSSSGQVTTVPTPDSPSREREDTEPEERKVTPRPFLRSRFLSKEEETQKVPERVQIPDEDYLDVFVCNVHSTDNICVNLSGENYSEKLTALEQSMLCHYEEPSTEEAIKINPGSIFAIYSKEIHSEGLWYRVKVLKNKGDKVQIEYMDYGDTGTVPTSSLRSIPPRFLELPFQACTISLNGLPKTKNAEVVLKLKHMTLGKDLVAEVIKSNGNKASVELYDTSSDVADININTMLRSLVIPDEEMVPVLPKAGEQIDAFVTYVTLQGNIFIQIPGGGTTRLEELMEDISEHYSQPTKAAEFVSNPHTDKICCAKCSDGAWYRAIVTKLLPDRQVEVQYVDYGNTEELPISSLREPVRAISHVNSLPFQALECKLEGTDKEGLTEEQACEIMERNVILEVVHASEVPPLVRLFVPSEEDENALLNLAELIGVETEQEAAETQEEQPTAGGDDIASEAQDDVSVDGDSVTSESSSDASKSPDEGDKLGTMPLPLDFSKPWVDICILECEDPSLFMFQCLEFLQQKEELEAKIQEYYTNKDKTPFKEVRPGVLCAAHNADNNRWYRAVIKASLSPQQTCVRFADYGDFGIVPSTSIQALPDEFRELPLMAVQGCLHGVEPVGADFAEWSQETINRFDELAAGKMLVAKPRGVANHSRSTNEETKMSLELYNTSEGNEDVLIADVLVSEGLAKRINET